MALIIFSVHAVVHKGSYTEKVFIRLRHTTLRSTTFLCPAGEILPSPPLVFRRMESQRYRMTPQPQSTANATNPATTANNRGINTPPSPPTPPPKNPRLSILSYLRAGLNPAKIAAKLSMPPSTLQYHLSILKKQGCISKAGYGTWEILNLPVQAKKRTAGLPRVGSPQHPPSRGSSSTHTAVLTQTELARFTQDSVRAHAFVFTMQVPRNLRNWNNKMRVKFLETNSIPFIPLGIGGGGQRIIVKDRKTWLLNRSIIIYDKASYFAEEALQAKTTALATHLAIIKHIERLLHTSFLIGSDYKFKVSRQHYSLIYNALAKQYNAAGEKLEIRTDKGAWFLIDNSYNMNEAETVHPTTAMSDNKKVQDFFNGVKTTAITPEFILQAMNGIQENQAAFAVNISSHIDAIRKLGSGVEQMNSLIGTLETGGAVR